MNGERMIPLFHLCIQQCIILFAFSPATSVSMIQDGNLISRIGNLFGEALRELTAEETEPAALQQAMIALEAPQQRVAPLEADRKEHAERTMALAGAIQSWVTQTCQLNEIQQGQLAELVTERLKTESERYEKADDPNRQNRPFGDTTPLLWMHSEGAGKKFSTQMLNLIREDILSDTQKEQLNVAVSERNDFHKAAFREYVVALFDKELFLTDEQRQSMLEQLSTSPNQITSPFYSFIGQTYYLPYQQLGPVLNVRNADFLDSRQKERLKNLASGQQNGNQNYLIFQSSEGPEQWAENVKQAAKAQREMYLNAAAVRIGFLERSLKLTSEQVAYLTVASKGATTDALTSWKESTRQTIDQMQAQMGQAQGNFAFSAQHVSIDGLDSNEIWTHAIRQVNAPEVWGNRNSVMQRAKENTVTALLDQELWLMPQQRPLVLKLASDALPADPAKSPYDEYIRELILLAYPLHRVAEPKIKEVLSDSQQAVWKQLKDFFPLNQGNNYVEIPMKNQGGSFQFQLSN